MMKTDFVINGCLFDRRSMASELEDNANRVYMMKLLDATKEEIVIHEESGEYDEIIFEHICTEMEDDEVTKLALDITNNYHTALHAGKPAGQIGTRYNAEYLSFVMDDKSTHSAFFPQFEFNGKLAMITDKAQPIGLKEFKTKDEALSFAKEFLLNQQAIEEGTVSDGLQKETVPE